MLLLGSIAFFVFLRKYFFPKNLRKSLQKISALFFNNWKICLWSSQDNLDAHGDFGLLRFYKWTEIQFVFWCLPFLLHRTNLQKNMPKQLRGFLRCTNLRNIWGEKSRGNVHYSCMHFWVQNFAETFTQKFAMQKNCKILRTKLHKNNHSANVCTIFCVNLCILKQFLQKFVQKSYGSFTLMLHDTFSPEFSVNCHITINCTDLSHAVRDVALAVQETNSVYCQ